MNVSETNAMIDDIDPVTTTQEDLVRCEFEENEETSGNESIFHMITASNHESR